MTESNIFCTERRVEFCETDAAGIAHFASLICYMEQAEHAFWRHLGTSVVVLEEDLHIGWPRVHVQCDYRGSAKFEDVLQISVRLLKLGSKSLTFGFTILRGGKAIAEGQMVTVCCEVRSHEALRSIVIPDSLREKLRPYLQQQPRHTT